MNEKFIISEIYIFCYCPIMDNAMYLDGDFRDVTTRNIVGSGPISGLLLQGRGVAKRLKH